MEVQTEVTRNEMSIMNHTGDVKKQWDPNNAVETADAKRSFDDLRAKGYLAFRVNEKDASKGEQIREFEPNAGSIIMVPPMAGG